MTTDVIPLYTIKMLLIILPYFQIVVSILLIAAILLQKRGAGLSAAFGGSADGGSYATKRGLEKIVFNATIVLAGLFLFSAFLNLLLK